MPPVSHLQYVHTYVRSIQSDQSIQPTTRGNPWEQTEDRRMRRTRSSRSSNCCGRRRTNAMGSPRARSRNGLRSGTSTGTESMGANRGQTNAKNAVIEIFELLWEETDECHGLTESEIQERLEERHIDRDIDAPAPSTRTIYNQIHWLSIQHHPILGRRVSKVDIEAARERTPDAKPGWYMEPFLSDAESRLLADSLMLSRIDRPRGAVRPDRQARRDRRKRPKRRFHRIRGEHQQ